MVACIGNHEVDGGYGKPRTKAPFFFALLRRPVPRHRLRHARLRRLPEPGPARHRPHRPDRRRPGRLAGQGAGERADRPHVIVGQPRPGLPVVPQRGGTAEKAGTGDGQPQALGAAVREVPRRRRAGTPRPHVQAKQPLKDGRRTPTASSTSATARGASCATSRRALPGGDQRTTT